MKKEQGFIGVIVTLAVLGFITGIVWFLGCIRIETSEQNVSGVVYNNTNNEWISGNTNFSIRAAVDTYVTQENQSSYCLPPHSPYIKLVNEAAENKNIKVIVTTKKIFKIVGAPWVCPANVEVKRVVK